CLAIEDEGQLAADQGDLVFLPFAGLLRRVHLGNDEAINRPHSRNLSRFAEVIEDLRLVATAQGDATVALVDELEFQREFKVLELLVGDYVDAALVVRHRAIFDAPAPFALFRTKLPARQVFAIEELDRRAPFRIRFRFERGGSDTGPFQRRAVFAIGRTFKLPAG